MGTTTDLKDFRIWAANLAGHTDTTIPIGASRAETGAGLLNLEFTTVAAEAQRAIDRVARLARNAFAVQLDAAFAAKVHLPELATAVIFTNPSVASLSALVAQARAAGRAALVQVTSSADASLAVTAKADGLVAKGQESGGIVGEETSFILLQRLRREFGLPVFVHGGIGPHSIAACYAGGAAGVILDAQLLLLDGVSTPTKLRAALERSSGDETLCIGRETGLLTRVWKRPGMKGTEELERSEVSIAGSAHAQDSWREALRSRCDWKNPETGVWPLGQDSGFAVNFQQKFRNIAGMFSGLRESIVKHVEAARALAPLAPNSPLAKAHRTTYPILQGPMTRVSDTAEFADAVAAGGGLPFLALALLRGPQVRRLMDRTRALAGKKSWGVGILGFVSAELREEQLEVVRDICPPFAIIAGGRPDQAAGLEKLGITTYLHVPAPSLLKVFLEDGARRFIFEGRECGGHVGPRTSFILWEGVVDTLLAAIDAGVPASELHVVFAGGIHDAQSSAMVAALAAPLAERGVKLGVLMGTAYLFTAEAVAGGAINQNFQDEAVNCKHTVILESGPGHATRCVDTGFSQQFRDLKRQMQLAGRTHEEIKDALEALNVGRLRIASKGIVREDSPAGPQYHEAPKERQLAEGMYMIGQIASLRESGCTVAELHESVTTGGTEWLQSLPALSVAARSEMPAEPPCDIAIVGMSCLLPKAADVNAFWANVVNKVNGITEVPLKRFDAARYYDEDKKSRDKMYSKWGGFLEDVAFDPMRYGIPPNALASIDPMQLIGLVAVEEALRDSGYDSRPFNRVKTSIILGMSGGLGDVGLNYAVRTTLPEYVEEVPESVKSMMPEWTEDTFAGILLNVTAGRIANRFDFGGVNFTVDAACASSLAAVHCATRELTSGSSDMVVTGGIDTLQSPFGFMCFAKSQALSPRGQCRPFDESADGIAISEGATILVLKRLADAERDGDRIYAVLKGVAGSSDGRGKSMTAPRPEGQKMVLRRAYAQAGFGPASCGLFEAHGTGTAAGDAAELTSLSETLLEDGATPHSIAVGSVKSMVGHTKAAAGITGLMKVALSLYHKVLPATLNVDKPNARLLDPRIPVYANTETRPWLRSDPDQPLRAGVSAFGFGGTNFHCALEEYTGDVREPEDIAAVETWPAELFLYAGAPEAITNSLNLLSASLTAGSRLPLSALAAQACSRAASRTGLKLAIVATSREDLAAKLSTAKDLLASGQTTATNKSGIYLAPTATAAPKIAFLYPGQGSQQPNMLLDLAIHFPEFRLALERADQALAGRFAEPLSRIIYPRPAFTKDMEKQQMAAVTATRVAQPALGAVEAALTHLFARLNVKPDLTAGHSYGEYVALYAAGVIDESALFELSERRGHAIEAATEGGDAGTMAAVLAEAVHVEAALNGSAKGITIANLNSPRQTIIAGARPAIEKAIAHLSELKLTAKHIPVACAFHSPLMEPARATLSVTLNAQTYSQPRAQVFSNTLAAAYPMEPEAISTLLADHLVSPVRFVEQIRAMYDAGARVFLEVGPKGVLTNLAKQNLEGRDAVVLQSDSTEKRGMEQFLHTLAQLAVLGYNIDTEELFRGRLRTLAIPARQPQWLVNGAGTFPAANVPAPRVPVRLVDPRTIQPVVKEVIKEVVRTVPGATTHPTASASAPPAAAESIVLQYQAMMQQFLTSQTAIMQSFLGGGAPAAIPAQVVPVAVRPVAPVTVAPPVTVAKSVPVVPAVPVLQARNVHTELLAIVSDRTGYPADMLDMNAGIESDLGIDSIKRVEILSAFSRACSPTEQERLQSMMEKLTAARTLNEMAALLAPLASGAAPVPVAPPVAVSVSTRNTHAELLAIVSDRTGYPADMLDANAGIESDLGIDSIKRVEILSAFSRSCSPAEQERLQSIMEKLTSARTLNEMAALLAPVAGSTPEPPQPTSPAPAPSRDVHKELLAIVSDRTGYPSDMLDSAAGIESDLGIDSIKRVEILSAFQRSCSVEEQARLQGIMEKLTSARTLNELSALLTPEQTAPAPVASVMTTVAAPKSRDIQTELLAIVSDRTGYPADMLDVNAGIESDLGIDSIKRVEILSAFQRACSADEQTILQTVMEKLTSARTLAELSGQLAVALRSSTPAPAPMPRQQVAVKVHVSEPASDSVPRFTLAAHACPRSSAAPGSFPGRLVLMTDDETGIASHLADRWKAAGERVLLLRHSPGSTIDFEGAYSTDLTDPAQIDALVANVRRDHGQIGAIVHLLPLQNLTPFAQLTFDEWRAQVRQDVRSIYLLARAAEADLKATTKAKGALLSVVTARGGSFGLVAGSSAYPSHFAVADYMKTLALEFDEVLCKVIDVDPSDPVAILRQKLLEELACRDEAPHGGALQIGLPGDSRLTVLPQLSPLSAAPLASVNSSSVVLLTGGARGITAGIARTLAKACQPTLILAGASPLPPAEDASTQSLTNPAQIKAALLAQLRAAGKTVRPKDVEVAYSRLSKNREILRNLAGLRKLGATVEYHSVDVRDQDLFGALIDNIYANHGRIDVVIHGAGVIEDKLLKDKTPESFDRVVHTKTDSSFILARKLRRDDVKCLIFMSSITAAFGNRGQADYAAANGSMNGISSLLAAEWPGHIVAMNWGPWDEGGMVNDDLRRNFLAHGIVPIPPAEGDEAVMRELSLTTQGDPISVFGEGPWAKLVKAEAARTLSAHK